MIDAEMYGMMPRAKIDSCSSAPPENMLNRPRNVPDEARMTCFITARFAPGVETKIPTR
jgi:hypothetical protein